MTRTKLVSIVSAVCALLVLGGCGAEENLEAAGDPPEVTCERFHGVLDEFRDIDPNSMGFGDILARVGEGFSEMETIADEAQDDELAQSIDTLSETLNSSIAASGGDIDAVGAEFQDRLQEPEIQEAATYLQETCGFEMPF